MIFDLFYNQFGQAIDLVELAKKSTVRLKAD